MYTIKLKQQHGAALVTSLIILLVLTVLGVSAMRTSSLEELMAGNQRDQNLSFQATETALIGAENVIVGWGGTEPYPKDDGSSGVFTLDKFVDIHGEYAATAHNLSVWNDATAYNISSTILSADPAFIIEQNGFVGASASYHDQVKHAGIVYYRITARGVGASPNAVTLLQETYGKRFK